MYRTSFLYNPRDGYEIYLPYFLRDSNISIKKVNVKKKNGPYSVSLYAHISDEDAIYLFLKYPDIREQFQQF